MLLLFLYLFLQVSVVAFLLHEGVLSSRCEMYKKYEHLDSQEFVIHICLSQSFCYVACGGDTLLSQAAQSFSSPVQMTSLQGALENLLYHHAHTIFPRL